MQRLLLSLLCAAPFVTAQSPVTAGVQPGTTNFVGGLVVSNSNPSPITQLFEVDVTDPSGIIITEIDVNMATTFSLTNKLDVYLTPAGTTANGNETNASVWTLASSVTVTFTGGRTTYVLTSPISLPMGTYGMALHHDGGNPIYTNPNSPTPALPPTYSTAEVTLDMSSARVRRSSALDPFDPTTGNGFAPRHANIALEYVVGGTFVSFTSDVTGGATPLAVQFTGIGATSNPSGIVGWAWDLDGDGTVDTTVQNPSTTYTTCGSYDVTVFMFDAGGTTQLTRTNYIVTDIVTPDFTAALIGQNTVQFTDTSTPTPTSWDWDLDGDGLTDSTAQNPIFVYPSGCVPVEITLNVGRLCQPTVTLTREIAVATGLETLDVGGVIISATATGGTNFIDADVTNPEGLTVCGMHVRSNQAIGQPLTVVLWQKPGTYVGSETDPTEWREVANETVTAAGPGERTFVSFSTPVFLASGVHGLAIQQIGSSPSYTNTGQVETFSNSDLTITAGITQGDPLFSGTVFDPRIWNGALYYATNSVTGVGGYGYIGAGCAGSLGVPTNTVSSQPVVGATMTANVDNVPTNAAVFWLGLSRTTSAFGPLPVDLAPFGAPGCTGYASPDSTLLLLGTGNTVSFNLAIPASTMFVGTRFFSQAFAFDAGANGLGGVMSDAAALVVGG